MRAFPRELFSERLPDTVESKNAEQFRQIVASQVTDSNKPTKLSLALDSKDIRTVTLSPTLAESLLEVLRLISSGHGFYMIPVEAELTTQQAADLLNVSRPFLVKLLEKNEIPFTKTGRHRRVRANDIFEYKKKRDANRSDALSTLARLDADEILA